MCMMMDIDIFLSQIGHKPSFLCVCVEWIFKFPLLGSQETKEINKNSNEGASHYIASLRVREWTEEEFFFLSAASWTDAHIFCIMLYIAFSTSWWKGVRRSLNITACSQCNKISLPPNANLRCCQLFKIKFPELVFLHYIADATLTFFSLPKRDLLIKRAILNHTGGEKGASFSRQEKIINFRWKNHKIVASPSLASLCVQMCSTTL